MSFLGIEISITELLIVSTPLYYWGVMGDMCVVTVEMGGMFPPP